MSNNSKMAIGNLISGIKILIDGSIRTAPFDKTRSGRVSSLISPTEVVVIMDGKSYTVKKKQSNTIAVNEIVYVTIPENNYSNMFIAGSGGSGGGGGGAVDSVNGKTGVVMLYIEDIPDLQTSLDGKLSANGNSSNTWVNMTPYATRENLVDGDTLSIMFGKIQKWFTDLKTVAFTGSYNDLTNKPTIPTKTSDLTNDSNFVSDPSYVHTDNNYTTTDKNKLAGIQAGAEVNVQSDWDETNPSSDAYIKNKPSSFEVNFETNPANIKMDGAVSVGTLDTVPRADHIHPAFMEFVDDIPIVPPCVAEIVKPPTYESIAEGYNNIVINLEEVVDGVISTTLKGNTAVNIVKNGNFANGITGWAYGNTIGVPTVTQNVVTFTASTQYGNIAQSLFKRNNTDKFYYRAMVKATSNKVILANNTTSIAHSGSGNWELLSMIYASTNGHLIIIRDDRTDSFTPISVAGVVCINLTEVFGVGNEPTKAQCDVMFPIWFDGMQGTSGSVESMGVNLFDGILTSGGYSNTTGEVYADNTRIRNINKFRVKPNSTIRCSINGIASGTIYYFYDTSNNFISAIGSSPTPETITVPSNAYCCNFSKGGFTDISAKVQIEYGTIITQYEPYKSTSFNYPTLHRLPNGICDELINGYVTKRIGEHTLISTDISELATDTTNVDLVRVLISRLVGCKSVPANNTQGFWNVYGFPNKVYVDSTDNVWTSTSWLSGSPHIILVVPKGTYANLAAAQTALAGTKIIYELAQPYSFPILSNLNCYNSGSVYVNTNGCLPLSTFTYPSNFSAKSASLVNYDYINSNGIKSRILYGMVLTTWIGSATPYTQVAYIDGVTELSEPIIDVAPYADYTAWENANKEFNKIYRITTHNGYVTLYAKEPTTVNFPIRLRGV